jgi:UDP-N-acetylmuramyl pentapeptide phosphotransferase/UDP-N-acetylglucosamine-1-phosphate transferase
VSKGFKLNRWLVQQKVILSRGYQWVNTPLISIIFIGSVKALVPWLVETRVQVICWAVGGLAGLYLIGWIDKRFRFFRAENDYITEENTIVMNMAQEMRAVASMTTPKNNEVVKP